MKRVSVAIAAFVALGLGATACAGAKRPALQPSAPVPGATLWDRPSNIAARDLYEGPWGREFAPDPNGVYRLVERKHSGVNLGMTVVDKNGREWSVKQPYPGQLEDEGAVEVALSRLLSAVGYHQAPLYYLSTFNLADDFGTRIEPGGRFRLKLDTMKDVGPWRWEDNPFIGSRPYQGLLVLLMMFNSTDLKNSNNTVYERTTRQGVERQYAVRDIGAALGDTNPVAPFKGRPDAFERTPFLVGVNNGHADFAYGGIYAKLVDDRVTPEEVAWACDLLAQLSERQMRDAFRAGGYEPAVAGRFVNELRERVRQGRLLGRGTPTATAPAR